MNIKTLGIYGYSFSELQAYKKKYRRIRLVIYLFDIIAMVAVTSLMFNAGSSISAYIWFLVGLVLVVSLITGVALDDRKYAIAVYANRLKDATLTCEIFHVDESDIEAILNKYSVMKKSADKNKSCNVTECVVFRLTKLFKHNKKHSRLVLSDLRSAKKEEGKFSILTYTVKNKYGDRIVLLGTVR